MALKVRKAPMASLNPQNIGLSFAMAKTSSMSRPRTITRADLVEAVYLGVGLSRTESADLVEMVLQEIANALEQGEPVKLTGFGVFKVRSKQARVGRNPKTGVEVPISARRVLTFQSSLTFRTKVNENL